MSQSAQKYVVATTPRALGINPRAIGLSPRDLNGKTPDQIAEQYRHAARLLLNAADAIDGGVR